MFVFSQKLAFTNSGNQEGLKGTYIIFYSNRWLERCKVLEALIMAWNLEHRVLVHRTGIDIREFFSLRMNLLPKRLWGPQPLHLSYDNKLCSS